MDWDCFELFASANQIPLPIRQKQFTVNTDLLRRTLGSVLLKKPPMEQMQVGLRPTPSIPTPEVPIQKEESPRESFERLGYVPIRPTANYTQKQSLLEKNYERVMQAVDDFDGRMSIVYAEKIKPVAKKFCPYTYIMQYKRKLRDLS